MIIMSVLSSFEGESDAKLKYSNEANYRSPLSTRYASDDMLYNWSDLKKFATWRKLWVILAKNEMVRVMFQNSMRPSLMS